MNYVVTLEKKENFYVVSSRIVAKQLGKRHSDVLRDLDKILINSNVGRLKNQSTHICVDLKNLIISNHYKDSKNRTYREYLLTKDGFTLYMFNIQGYNDFKMAYINEFNRMEQALKEPKEQKKLPFSEVKPTTWRGVPVMEVSELEKLTGIDRCLIHTNLRKDKITLRHRDFLEYKEENSNNYYASASSVSLLFKEVVIWICKKYGVYEKYKDFLENYFKEVKEIGNKNIEYGLEYLRSEANKLKQKLLKEQFLITEKIQDLDKTGLTDKMTVHRNNKNELILITHFD